MKPTILPQLWLAFSRLRMFARIRKFQFFGADSVTSHALGHKYYISTLEYYQSENNDKPIFIIQLNTELSYCLPDRVASGGNFPLAIPGGSRFVGFDKQRTNAFGSDLDYTIHLSDQRYLQFRWRWMHISNEKGLVPANPAFDGNGLYLTYKYAK